MINHFKKLKTEKLKTLSVLGIFIFAFIINQISGNRGLFPLDSASHFDNGYRILSGQHPVKDYWIISGFIIDYLQSFLFLLFGTNWQVYVAHASLFNGLLAVLVLFFFHKIGLSFFHAIITSVSFSVLAYTISGTPFVDQHSSFFSLAAIIFLILGIKFVKKNYFILVSIFLFLAVLSKPVPAFYFFIFIFLTIILHVFKNKRKIDFLYFVYGIVFSLSMFFLLIFINKINLNDFYLQNFLYPQSIGVERLDKLLSQSFWRIISQYKFIFFLNLILIYLFYINYKKIKKNSTEILIVIFTSQIFIFHQILTKNQIFINFIIPFLIGYILSIKENKRYLNYFLIFLMIFLTFKYHLRFNHDRKFHELNYVSFNKALSADKIHKSLRGLNWITPQYKDNPDLEIKDIIDIKNKLINEKEFILLTNYSFYSVILEKNTFSPSRWYTFDGTDYPRGKNIYKKEYKKLLLKLIKENNIKKIFLIDPITEKEIYSYLNKNCFLEKSSFKRLKELIVLNCSEKNY